MRTSPIPDFEKPKIAIVGAGTAGPVAAALLARQNHEVTLFERAHKLSPVGAGFLLQPTGLSVLTQLGIDADFLPHTAAIERLHCHLPGGRTLLDLSYDELSPGLRGYGTHRATLLQRLMSVATNAGAEIELGVEMKRREGRQLVDSQGKCHGPFDLIVICDGARSPLRDSCGIPHRVDKYPWGALWFIGKRTPDFERHTLYQVCHGTRQLNGYLPTGTSDDLLSLFWSARIDELTSLLSRPLQHWKDDVCRLVPRAEEFLTQIDDMRQLQPATYYDVRMKRWHGEGVVVLGDAAHALSPQLGQGINLAFMDAATLADCLAQFPLAEALATYSARRRKHLRFYQFATRWSTPFFQSDYEWLAPLRDVAFPIANRLGYSRRQMVATMAGLKTGPFSQIKA